MPSAPGRATIRRRDAEAGDDPLHGCRRLDAHPPAPRSRGYADADPFDVAHALPRHNLEFAVRTLPVGYAERGERSLLGDDGRDQQRKDGRADDSGEDHQNAQRSGCKQPGRLSIRASCG